MQRPVYRIIKAFYNNYCEPLNQMMYPDRQIPYYPEQEETYTDLSQLDSEHGGLTMKERYPFNYPPTVWNNPSWADGDLRSPYKNDWLQYENFAPYDNFSIFDHLKGGKIKVKDNTVKVACMDLTDFFKCSSDILIHKSKHDLWKVLKDETGEIYIKRLFPDNKILKD